MSDRLPLDLVTNILLRLPVVAILRCRAVCEPWRALIDSPRFIKLQIDYSAATTKNAVLFIREEYRSEPGLGDLHFAPYIDGLHRETCIDFGSTPAARISSTIPRECITLIGSCDGLLCFSYDRESFIITNPATRKEYYTPALRNLCSLGSKKRFVSCDGCGFGYDSASGDYKVVAVYRTSRRNVVRSELISNGAGSNSGVSVDFPYFISTWKIGLFVGGAIHWMLGRVNSDVIVGFDLGLNECREVPQPECPNGESFFMRIGELGKCLCIFSSYCESVVELWMMKEYGVKESWSLMFSVQHPGLCYAEIRSLGCSMTGQEILLELDNERLVWYDLRNQNGAAKEVTIRGLEATFISAIVCFGSLVSPDGKFVTDEVKVNRKRQTPRLPRKKKRVDVLVSK